MKHHSLLLIVVLAILAVSDFCHAQSVAAIPYREVIRIARGDQEDPGVKSYRLKIRSSLDVPPEKIMLELQSSENPEFLIVSSDGYFEVPNSKDLYAENPFLVSNQIKGSLNISFDIEVPPFAPPEIVGGKISYTKLFAPLIEMQKHVRKVKPSFGLVGSDQFALKIKTDQPIVIRRESGPEGRKVLGARTYRPIEGVVYLLMEAYMFEDDPLVEIPGTVQMELVPVDPVSAEKLKVAY